MRWDARWRRRQIIMKSKRYWYWILLDGPDRHVITRYPSQDKSSQAGCYLLLLLLFLVVVNRATVIIDRECNKACTGYRYIPPTGMLHLGRVGHNLNYVIMMDARRKTTKSQLLLLDHHHSLFSGRSRRWWRRKSGQPSRSRTFRSSWSMLPRSRTLYMMWYYIDRDTTCTIM